ncbi:MAG: hypothetical protein IJC88_04820 [Oscillospiraceae bacterium]|nr:hypothetical protein [Oscillospiraceae bacterium]
MELNAKKYDLMRYRMLKARARGALDAGNTTLAHELASCAEVFRLELIDRISHIEDERVRTVLSLRYLHGLDWETIAEQMFFSVRWVMKLHRKGIEVL